MENYISGIDMGDSLFPASSRFVVGIGASAGGPKALVKILENLRPDVCGILIVQHLSKGFYSSFAQYLDGQVAIRVKEARTGETVQDGVVYLPSDGCQMSLVKRGYGFALTNEPGEKVGGFAPAINPLFHSIAKIAGKNSMGIILTGMGEDGADGLMAMKKAGAYTIVQNRETSEIFSMPAAACSRGAAMRQVPLENIAAEINGFCKRMKQDSGR